MFIFNKLWSYASDYLLNMKTNNNWFLEISFDFFSSANQHIFDLITSLINVK